MKNNNYLCKSNKNALSNEEFEIEYSYKLSYIKEIQPIKKIIIPEGTSSLLFLDFNMFPFLEYKEIDGSIYYSDDDNDYKVLVKAHLDENGDFHMNENTIYCANYSFYINSEPLIINNLFVGEKYRGSIFSKSDNPLTIKKIYSWSKEYSDSHLTYEYKGLEEIHAYNCNPDDFKSAATDVLMVICYLKDKKEGKENLYSQRDLIEKYIIDNKEKFYKELNSIDLLTLFLNFKIISARDIYDLIRFENDPKRKELLVSLKNKFFDEKCFEEKEHTINTIENNYSLRGNEKDNYLPSQDLITSGKHRSKNKAAMKPNSLNPYFDEPNLNIPRKKKFLVRMKDFIKKDDIFVAKANNEIAFFKVVSFYDTDKNMGGGVILQLFVPDEFKTNRMITSKDCQSIFSNTTSLMPNINYRIVDFCTKDSSIMNIIQYHINIIDNSNRIMYSESSFLSDFSVKKYPDLGLFKDIIIDGKRIKIECFDNSKNAIVPKEYLKFFEPYFYYDAPFNVDGVGELYLRKIQNKNNMLEELILMSNNLLVNILDINSAGSYPFKRYNSVVNKKIKNELGLEYDLSNVIQYLSLRVRAVDNTNSVNNLVKEFSIKNLSNPVRGFNRNELVKLLDNNFNFDITEGYYIGYDSYRIINDDLVMYDAEWLLYLYNVIKKNPAVEYNTITDIPKPRKNIRVFETYTLFDYDLKFVISIIKESESFYEFINNLVPYIGKL